MLNFAVFSLKPRILELTMRLLFTSKYILIIDKYFWLEIRGHFNWKHESQKWLLAAQYLLGECPRDPDRFCLLSAARPVVNMLAELDTCNTTFFNEVTCISSSENWDIFHCLVVEILTSNCWPLHCLLLVVYIKNHLKPFWEAPDCETIWRSWTPLTQLTFAVVFFLTEMSLGRFIGLNHIVASRP